MQPEYRPHIYLASNSPRRRELLDRIGVHYAWMDPGVDEVPGEDESPEVFVLRMALEKARAGYRSLDEDPEREPLPVMGADTVVVLDNEILGKPRSREHGLEMLQSLAGNTHRVLTGVALADDREATRLSVSHVTFREVERAEIERYWATGEPQDKAGGYAIQGRAAVFVEHLEGSYSGVMGLPLFETAQLLDEFEIDYQRHW